MNKAEFKNVLAEKLKSGTDGILNQIILPSLKPGFDVLIMKKMYLLLSGYELLTLFVFYCCQTTNVCTL